MKLTRTLSLATIFVVSILSAASCGSTGNVGVETDIPLPLGGSVGLTFGVGFGGETTADVTGTPLCIEVCYRGADGGDLGCTVVEVPGSDQVPTGAVSWSATVVDCPPSSGGGDGDGGSEMFNPPTQQRSSVHLKMPYYSMFGGSIMPRVDGVNLTYSFGLRAQNSTAAASRRDYVLAGGIGVDVGNDFRVAMWNETNSESDLLGIPVGVRMKHAVVNDDFSTFDLTINGTRYADLSTSNLLHYGASNGWNVVETFVPVSAFDTGASYSNLAESTWTLWNSARAWTAMQRVWN